MDKGKKHEAEITFLNAFTHLDHDSEVIPNCFFKASRYFSRQKQYDEALNIVRKGTQHMPDNVKMRILAASLYERAGILYRAKEEYKTALILDPKNKQARSKLEKL